LGKLKTIISIFVFLLLAFADEIFVPTLDQIQKLFIDQGFGQQLPILRRANLFQ
jgi:hypothetical protein